MAETVTEHKTFTETTYDLPKQFPGPNAAPPELLRVIDHYERRLTRYHIALCVACLVVVVEACVIWRLCA